MKLIIVPFAGIAPVLPRESARRIRAVLPWKITVSAPLPHEALDSSAIQLAAEQPLAQLPWSGQHDELTVGLTERDLRVADLDYVFGYAEPARRVAVISLFRLTDGTASRRGGRRLLIERTAKEILHETGHLMGLEHCDRTTCVMHYSQVLQDTDIKSCGYCARWLKQLSRLPEASGER